MRQQDVLDLHVAIANGREQLVDLVAGIDEDRLARALAPDDEAVLVERRDGSDFENHSGLRISSPGPSRTSDSVIASMILCVVDDLIFSVKISTAAKALGVDVYFERAADSVVPRIREKRPSLVIFDLNSARLRPLEAIAG